MIGSAYLNLFENGIVVADGEKQLPLALTLPANYLTESVAQNIKVIYIKLHGTWLIFSGWIIANLS